MIRFAKRALPVLLVLCGAAAAQERTVAIRNARVLTMSGDTLEKATVLLRGGVIEAVGADVEVPAGAEVVDAGGGTLMPGLVSAFSRAGLPSARQSEAAPTRSRRRFRFRGRGPTPSTPATNKAASKVTDAVYARQDVFGELLRCGVTTLALAPRGAGFPGQGAVLDPAGKTLAQMTLDDEAFVLVSPSLGTKNKKLLKESLEKAQKVVEARKKPAEAPKTEKGETGEKKEKGEKGEEKKAEEKKEGIPPEKPPEKKEGEEKKQEGEQKKPEGEKKAAPEKKDPNLEVLADVLEGKRRAFLEIGSASDLAHYKSAVDETVLPERALVAASYSSTEGRLDEVLDELAPLKAPILVSPTLTTPAYSSALVNPAARLHEAGYEVGFVLGDSKSDLRQLFFKLIELVRCGLDRDAALRAVTLVPAKALGLHKRVGAIAAGLDADLLLFDRDPLDPAGRLVRIWHKGVVVEKERTQ